MTFNPQSKHPLDQLRFLSELGVTEALEETAGNLRKIVVKKPSRLDDSATTQPQTSSKTSAAITAAPSAPAHAKQALSVSDAVSQARAAAEQATDLESLKAAITAFDGCPLKKTASNTVIARGNPDSDIMLIGEAPGAEEDRQGIPFCGPSGQLLDKMLGYIGLGEEKFYISNTIFWRPPGNRKPTQEEIAICRPFVEKQIQLISPKLIVLVGGTATNALLQRPEGITRLRGKIYSYHNDYIEREIPTHVVFHPSYLLRQPMAKKTTWQDLLRMKQALSS